MPVLGLIACTRPAQSGLVKVNMDQGGINELLPFLVELLLMVDLEGGAVWPSVMFLNDKPTKLQCIVPSL